MTTWYEDMAKAVRKREIALSGQARWEQKLAAAEAEIERLSSLRSGGEAQLPSADSIAAEASQLAPDLQPTFGAAPTFDGPLFIDSVNA